MKYYVKSSRGEQLVCPSLADLRALYARGFLGDEDLVRADRSERWVPAGRFPALQGLRERRAEPWKAGLLLAAAALVVLALVWLLRTHFGTRP